MEVRCDVTTASASTLRRGKTLAKLVAEIVGYDGDIVLDSSKPDGTPVKRTNIDVIRSIGWSPQTDLRQGLVATYADFQQELEQQVLRCQLALVCLLTTKNTKREMLLSVV